MEEAAPVLEGWEEVSDGRQSAVYSLLGHKGDLLFVHFRRSFEELNRPNTLLHRQLQAD